MIYAFDRCFEGAIAACAAPLVGMLAEKMFGFTVSCVPTGCISSTVLELTCA